MKKVLFLTYGYPYGKYGASSACSTRVMKALSEEPNIEVHCVSYKQEHIGVQPYSSIPDVVLYNIPLKARRDTSRFMEHIQMAMRLPFYPLFSIKRIWNHYKACKEICTNEYFDLVVAQYLPEESAYVGMLLKKYGFINKLAVIFWDNIYGMKPARFIPSAFAIRRKKIAEGYLAKYSDVLISLYPLKPFHDQSGELKSARGKRHYLGIPSVLPPIKPVATKYIEVIKKDKINILYSGSIIKPQFVYVLIDILNKHQKADNFNLIFFSKGLSDDDFNELRTKFKGTIQSPGFIPINELLSVYNYVDVFISFPGDVRSIRSKVFEYMSYGHPILILFNDPNDVNVSTFARYPLCHSININEDSDSVNKSINSFIDSKLGKHVPFTTVEDLFIKDSPVAYVNFIKSILQDS